MNQWQLNENNKKASIDLWDSMAEDYGDYKLSDFEENSFLKLLVDKEMFRSDSLVLDVGCGAGKYANVIAPRCKAVTGIDLSSRMIDFARRNSVDYDIGNTDFICGDWHDLCLEKNGFIGKFDLVFAHMTPAVQSADSFEKLSSASHGWCVLSKPTRRTDPVSDAVMALAGTGRSPEDRDNEIVYAFELLWKKGLQPHLEYEQQQWHMEKTLEQAYALYINRVKSRRDISSDEEDVLKKYIRSLAKDGLIIEDIDTTITTLYWHV